MTPEEAAEGLAYDSREQNRVVTAFLADQVPSATMLDAAIHGSDEMLRYAVDACFGQRDLALVSYFASGLAADRVVRQIATWRGARSHESLRILDFASGYGRVTRFLAATFDPSQLWISDVHPEAVEFQRRRFGVHGIVSSPVPEDFDPPDRFDLVFACSFFSHLAESTFERWLARLLAVVAEDGLLVLSVHDEAVLPPGREMPASGHCFEPISESATLRLEDYGSTWVTEQFLTGLVRRLAGNEARLHRIPRGLWHFQDLYVIVPGADRDPATLALDRGPESYLYAAREDGTELVLEGWAVDHGPEPGWVRIQVLVDGEIAAELSPSAERPDVAASRGSRHLRSGWQCRIPRPASERLLLVKAVSASGLEFVAFLGLAGLAGIYHDLQATTHALAETRDKLATLSQIYGETLALCTSRGLELSTLRHRLRAMESSRFWKLRNAWFGVKDRVAPRNGT